MARATMATRYCQGAAAASVVLLFGGTALAKPPPQIVAQNRSIGPIVELARTAAAYAPLHADEPYAGATVIRNLRYGAGERAILDVFKPAASVGKPPILIFLQGGSGAIHGEGPYGKRLDDNVTLWAARHGMVGLLVQWESGPGVAWDQSAKNVGEAIAWARSASALHGGDVGRIYLWGMSSGAQTLATYLGRPELHPDGDPGVKGAVLSSGFYNLAPLRPASAPPAAVDADTLMARSLLEGVKALTLPVFVTVAEFDPAFLADSAHQLEDQLCMAGRCPRYIRFADHSHMSTLYSVNTDDESVSAPILDFIQHAS